MFGETSCHLHFTQPVAIPKTLEKMATRATKTSAQLPVKPDAA